MLKSDHIYPNVMEVELLQQQKPYDCPSEPFYLEPQFYAWGVISGRRRSEERSGKSIIVLDVGGGTTTDVGVLLPSGFPRQAAAITEVTPNSSQDYP